MISGRGLFARGPSRGAATRPEAASDTRAMPVRLLHRDRLKRRAMVSAVLVADPTRCVECGICTYNCPLGIDIRARVRLGRPVADGFCLTCGECVARCPRGTLRFEVSSVFSAGSIPGDG
jgi:heterodisulfide reductase subunit C